MLLPNQTFHPNNQVSIRIFHHSSILPFSTTTSPTIENAIQLTLIGSLPDHSKTSTKCFSTSRLAYGDYHRLLRGQPSHSMSRRTITTGVYQHHSIIENNIKLTLLGSLHDYSKTSTKCFSTTRLASATATT